MAFLLDTNVVSEMMRPHPEPRVARFLDRVGGDRLNVSAITAWEILNGIGRLDHQSRRDDLGRRFRNIMTLIFQDRVLDWTATDAEECARIMEDKRRLGESLDRHLPNAMLAGTAASRGLSIVTRNTRDYRNIGIAVINPWDEAHA